MHGIRMLGDVTHRVKLHGSQVRLSALLAACLLPACSTIDQVAPRSARYNVAAVDSRNRSILSNVLRAAYGKPLQFTELTTATGQATLGGELGLTLPFDVDPDSTARTFNGTPRISASGTSTFNVASLSSKEFYQGLQSPISVQQIANFIASGYDPQIVLFLAISEIEVQKPSGRVSFRSGAETPLQYELFHQAVRFLLEAGLSTKAGEPSPYGPPIPVRNLINPEAVATLLPTSPGELALKESSKGTYQLFRRGSYQFCFDPMKLSRTPFLSPGGQPISGHDFLRVLPAKARPSSILGMLYLKDKRPSPEASFNIEPGYYCDAPEGAERKAITKILIRTRSVEGIFLFLGDVARKQLALGKAPSAPLTVTTANGGRNFFPFRVVDGIPSDAALTVQENGKSYSIVTDASGLNDQTTRAVQLLTDLLALQSSAKDLPAPNVISILGR